MGRPAEQVVELARSGKFRSDEGSNLNPLARPRVVGVRSRIQGSCEWQVLQADR
jgi:hypothetical protein